MDQKLIEKYLRGTLLPYEKEEVMRWIEASNENREEFLRLRKVYDISIWNPEFSSNKETKKRSGIFSVLFKVAAVSLILLGIGFGFFITLDKDLEMSVETITCPQGQRLDFVLSDGTKVWLNSNSTLTLLNHDNKGSRVVELNGEAYFEVTHDKKHPFIVKTKFYDITVLGTTFNVFSYNDSELFQCSLIEGAVSLRNHLNNTEIRLQSNEKLSFDKGAVSHSRINEDEEFLWRVGICSFRNQPLSEVFEHLSLAHEVKIELRNTKIGEQMCTGKFRNKDGIDHILSILQKSYQFTYTKDDETHTYVIY